MGEVEGRRPILFLISDTGAGHRRSAQAVAAAWQKVDPGATIRVEDALAGPGAPGLLTWSPVTYHYLINWAPRLWGHLFHLTDGALQVRLLTRILAWIGLERSLERRFREAAPALIVSFHPLLNHLGVRARDRACPGVPFATVVTDLVSAHPFWFCPAVDLLIVPLREVAGMARDWGVPAARIRRIGLPANPAFRPPAPGEREALRRTLGWDPDRFTVLLTGGGNGSGGLHHLARQLSRCSRPLQLVAVAGRNRLLERRLRRLARRSPVPLHVYGFTDRMPELMRAADLLVCRAGPGTVTEALNTHLPMILYGYLPGQEEGNVRFVEEGGAGYYLPDRDRLAALVRELADDPERLEALRQGARRLAQPEAAREIVAALRALGGAAPADRTETGAEKEEPRWRSTATTS